MQSDGSAPVPTQVDEGFSDVGLVLVGTSNVPPYTHFALENPRGYNPRPALDDSHRLSRRVLLGGAFRAPQDVASGGSNANLLILCSCSRPCIGLPATVCYYSPLPPGEAPQCTAFAPTSCSQAQAGAQNRNNHASERAPEARSLH